MKINRRASKIAQDYFLDEKLIPINDRIMNFYEYQKALAGVDLQRELVGQLHPTDPLFNKEPLRFVELLITTKGHAWCMDVKQERRKMAKLITREVGAMFELN